MTNESPKDHRLNPNHPEDTQAPNDSKKPYHAPHLVIYGPLRDLTAGGSSGDIEDKVGSTNEKKQRL